MTTTGAAEEREADRARLAALLASNLPTLVGAPPQPTGEREAERARLVRDVPTAVGAPLHPAEAPLERGELVGRYVIVSQLGRGGMGVVYAAYDPELDRKVALKLLLAGVGDTHTGGDARTRLLREAQALARLSHPAVVTVHDVGTLGDRVWLAMEFIDGQTLAAWLRQRPRGWREVLDVYRRAGEGLAAAHAAGLVHRDFKPDNVMVHRDGRVLVMDFGLACADHHRGAELPPRSTDLRASSSALGVNVTQAGAIMGTPQYMAPEQWLGEPTDARTDQFAFCVALWEALYDQRPHGDNPHELALRVTEGRRRDPPPRARVPSWLRRAVERGMCVAPAARWRDMPRLLAVLAGGARRRRRSLAVAVACVLAVAAAALVVRQRWQHSELVAACVDEGARIGEVWDPAARDRLRDALLATGVPYARSTFARLAPQLDAYAADWQRARTRACASFLVERTWTADTAERGQQCLAEARWSLEGLLATLADPDPELVQAAINAAARLPAPGPCIDPVRLAHAPRLPSEQNARHEAARVRRGLMRVRSLNVAGRYHEAGALARHLVTRADALAWTPLTAQARLIAAEVADRAGENSDAEAHAAAALELAAEAGEDGLLADSAIVLVDIVGDNLARYDDGLRWARLADALLRRLGEHDSPRGARLLTSMTGVHESRGDYATAEPLGEQALAAWERLLGPDHPSLTGPLNNLAILRYNLGHTAEARALFERALAVTEQNLGPDHPSVAAMLNNLGNVNYEDRLLDAAIPLFERSLAIREGALGPDHASLIGPLTNLAAVHLERNDLPAAELAAARAFALAERNLGPDHPDLADPLEALAIVHKRRGELDRALVEQLRVLAIRRARLGADHPNVASAQINLGDTHLARADLRAAELAYAEALALVDRTRGNAEQHRPIILLGLAELALARHRNAEAVRTLEQALALPDVSPATAERLRAALARAQAPAAATP